MGKTKKVESSSQNNVIETKKQIKANDARFKKYKPVPMREINTIMGIMKAIQNADSTQDKLQIMAGMREKDLNIMCGTLNDMLNDRGKFKNKIPNPEYELLGQKVKPYATDLRKTLDPKVTYRTRRTKMFGPPRKQKGGQVGEIVGPIVASLLPVAINAIKTWLSPKSDKKTKPETK